jgi:hypothetical protein
MIATMAANTRTPMLENTPMTAVRFEKKLFSARFWVRAEGLVTSAVTVSNEVPSNVRYVVVSHSEGSVEILFAADVLVDTNELDWDWLMTVLDEV